MAIVRGSTSGDAVASDYIDIDVSLGDPSPNSVKVRGSVDGYSDANPRKDVSADLTGPAPPGSGNTFWNIQVDRTTGAVTIQTSASVDPALIDANQTIVFRQTLPTGAPADLSLTGAAQPNSW